MSGTKVLLGIEESNGLDNIELDNWNDGKKTLKPIGMQEIAGQAGHYTSLTPLYSYATNWAENINNRVTIVVVVPWAQGTETQEGTNFTETYYEIPINDSEERLDRNTYYKLALEIGVVGSLQEEQPLEILNCSYIILPWGTGHSDVDASLAAVRYLVGPADRQQNVARIERARGAGGAGRGADPLVVEQ